MEGDNYITLHFVWPVYLELMGLLAAGYEDDDDDFSMVSKMKFLGRKYMDKNRDDMKPTFIHKFMTFLNPSMKKLKKISCDERAELHADIQSYLDNNAPVSTVNSSQTVSTEDLADNDEDLGRKPSKKAEVCEFFLTYHTYFTHILFRQLFGAKIRIPKFNCF